MGNLKSYSALGILSSLYAISLNTETGKEFAKEHTWITVVIGTSLVLACIKFVLPKCEWRKVATAFVIGGIPMICRSLYNKVV